MARMTEEEAFALDEKWTKTDPKIGHNGTGFFTRRKAALAAQEAPSITIDKFTADYLLALATSSGKTPADIISEMVQEKIAQLAP